MTDFLFWGLVALIALSVFTVVMTTIIIAKRRVRKEIGLLKQHWAYRPQRARKKLHFGEYGKRPEQGGPQFED